MQGLQLAKYNEWCTVFQTADMNPWLSIVRRLGFHSSRVLKFSAAPWPFCVALSPSVHWYASFLYCCALYSFFFLGFRQWLTRVDRVVNLNATIWIPLFWRIWTLVRAWTCTHVLALRKSLAHMCKAHVCLAQMCKAHVCLAHMCTGVTSELWPIDLAQSESKIPATPWVVAWFTTLFRSVSALSKASSKNVHLAPFEETSVCLSGRVPLGQEWYCWTNSWKAWFSTMEGLSYHLDQSKIHRFIR